MNPKRPDVWTDGARCRYVDRNCDRCGVRLGELPAESCDDPIAHVIPRPIPDPHAKGPAR